MVNDGIRSGMERAFKHIGEDIFDDFIWVWRQIRDQTLELGLQVDDAVRTSG